MIRVLLIEDHGVVRDALATMIAAEPDLEVVGATGSGRDGVRLAASIGPDVVLLDYGLPDIDGLEAARQLSALTSPPRILVLSMSESPDVCRRMLAIGATGYVLKANPSTELLDALRKTARGRRHVSPQLVEALLDDLTALADAPPEAGLTERELQVLRQIAAGMGPTDIARYLSISTSTVETYRARIKTKLGLHSTAELIRFAVRRGLVEL